MSRVEAYASKSSSSITPADEEPLAETDESLADVVPPHVPQPSEDRKPAALGSLQASDLAVASPSPSPSSRHLSPTRSNSNGATNPGLRRVPTYVKLRPSRQQSIAVEVSSASSGGSLAPSSGKAQEKLWWLRRNWLRSNPVAHGVVDAVALALALFGGSLFVLFDIADDPGTAIQDTLMTCVAVWFSADLLLHCVFVAKYVLSIFFWMDAAGTISMIFEVSYLLGEHGKMSTADRGANAVLLRTARAAKVGARAARLSKVGKVMSHWMRRRQLVVEAEKELPDHDAQALKAKLTRSLASRVAVLVILLVMVVPLFNLGRYPEEDFSMQGWGRNLELSYATAHKTLAQDWTLQSTTSELFQDVVEDMMSFFGELNYQPYRLEGYPEQVEVAGRACTIPGEQLVSGETPQRLQNIIRQSVHHCRLQRTQCSNDLGTRAEIYFDMREPNQYEAAMDIAVIAFIVLCMVLETFGLSLTIDIIIVKPVERILGTLQLMAKILRQGEMPEDVEEEPGDILEEEWRIVFETVAKLKAMYAPTQSHLCKEVLDSMEPESRGVLLDLMNHRRCEEDQLWGATEFLSQTELLVPSLPVSEAEIESWNLDLLGMSGEDVFKVMLYIFFDSRMGTKLGGVGVWIDLGTFQHFHDHVQSKYLDLPYHNFTHACDVVSSVFRLLCRLKCSEWLSDIDRYALLVAALAHDVGHPGRTTPFLLEIGHELALRYNDSSPLENMHCATLFEICQLHNSNAFGRFSKDAYRQARKVCIQAILHTDNAKHMEMVKELQKVYDSCMLRCDSEAANTLDEISEEYHAEVLVKEGHLSLWHGLLLHLADVSAPLKPWRINVQWATRVQDEFFAQGDEEKDLGIPVGMLNDREKVSRSGAEHGFINFLVSPLVLAAVSIFPPLHHLAAQMKSNMQAWRDLWVQDVQPPPEDIKKRDADIQKLQDAVDRLRAPRRNRRNPASSAVILRSVPPTATIAGTGAVATAAAAAAKAAVLVNHPRVSFEHHSNKSQ